MSDDVEKKLEQARKLIKAKEYEKARKILIKLDDPTARRWVVRLDDIRLIPDNPPAEKTKQKPKKKEGCLLYWMRAASQLVAIIVFGIIGLMIWADLTTPKADPKEPPKSDRVGRIQWVVEKAVTGDVHVTSSSQSLASVEFPVVSLFGGAGTYQYEIVKAICAMVKDGIIADKYGAAALADFTDAYGKEIVNTAVEAEVLYSDARRIDCDNEAAVNLPIIADYYYQHPAVN